MTSLEERIRALLPMSASDIVERLADPVTAYMVELEIQRLLADKVIREDRDTGRLHDDRL